MDVYNKLKDVVQKLFLFSKLFSASTCKEISIFQKIFFQLQGNTKEIEFVKNLKINIMKRSKICRKRKHLSTFSTNGQNGDKNY